MDNQDSKLHIYLTKIMALIQKCKVLQVILALHFSILFFFDKLQLFLWWKSIYSLSMSTTYTCIEAQVKVATWSTTRQLLVLTDKKIKCGKYCTITMQFDLTTTFDSHITYNVFFYHSQFVVRTIVNRGIKYRYFQ